MWQHSSSQGSQRLWCDFNFALKKPPKWRLPLRFTNITEPLPICEPSCVITNWSLAIGVVMHEVEFKAVCAFLKDSVKESVQSTFSEFYLPLIDASRSAR